MTWMVAGTGFALVPVAVSAQVFLTQEEALELAFPESATVGRRSAFLTEEQLASARRLAGDDVEIDQRVVTYYVASVDGSPVGVAYFDAHRVRTKAEVVMIVVGESGTIERVEVLSFAEPRQYLVSEAWLEQLNGHALDEELEVGRGIVNMTGATLTAGALTRASRRILALHRVIRPFEHSSDG